MALTKEFIEAVENGKKTRVRIMLKDTMLVNPSLQAFEEMISYANNIMTDLFDWHDGEELIDDSSEWDEDYMNQQMVSVVTNFSKERVELLKKMVKKLYAHKIQPELKSVSNTTRGGSSSTNSSSKSGLSGIQGAGGVIAVVGAGVLIGGIVGSRAPVAIVGGVALAGGIAMVALGGNKEA